jgi:hypothetical protein
LPSARATDANFFALVHHVLQSQKTDTEEEQREQKRKRYSCLQHAAIYRNGVLPTRNEFFPILCSDLSSGGVSFLTNRVLAEQFLVLALGKEPQMFLSAEVVNQTAERIANHQVHRVGCRFVGRLHDIGLRLPSGGSVGIENLDSAISLLDTELGSPEGERRR